MRRFDAAFESAPARSADDAHVGSLIERQLAAWAPPGFAACVALAGEAWPVAADERLFVADAVAKRRAEFVAGRWCAHEALRAVGRAADVLPPGPLGAPIWPPGSIGSITHDGPFCCAVAGPTGAIAAIGIDLCLTAHEAVMETISKRLRSRAERSPPAEPGAVAVSLRTHFCVKEAVVKAASGVAARLVDLREITVGWSGTSFVARVEGVAVPVGGWWAAVQGHALALAVLFDPRSTAVSDRRNQGIHHVQRTDR